MERLAEEQIKRLRVLLDKATPGRKYFVRSLTCGHIRDANNMRCDPKEEITDDDIDLMNESLNALPALLDEVEELRGGGGETAQG